jgi:hypothetical protein
MRHPWIRRAPLLLVGLTDLGLGGYLLWLGGREILRADGPAEATLSGFVFLVGLLTCVVGLPALWWFGHAERFAPGPLLRRTVAALLIGGLPWAGVAWFFWPTG